MSDPTLRDRLTALKGERDQARSAKDRAFAELQPETRITEDTISAFAALMRENVAKGAILVRRAYLRSVIDQFEIGDPTLADAILDRLVHNAHRLELAGESMRKINARHKKLDREPNP